MGLIRYPGGKGLYWRSLSRYLPRADVYVEVFGGGAAVLLNKEPSRLEVYNDIDGDLVNLFRVVSDPRLFRKFRRRVQMLPWARGLYRECYQTYKLHTDPVERAWRFYVLCRQSYCGVTNPDSWGYSLPNSQRTQTPTWAKAINKLPLIHARLVNVQFDQLDWRLCLNRYDSKKTLFYLDPPYIGAHPRCYRHTLSDRDHLELVNTVIRLKGMVAISMSCNPTYRRLCEFGFVEIAFTRTNYMSKKSGPNGQKKRFQEALYLNPACVQALKEEGRWHNEDS